jgi:uncharacterized protein
VAAAERGQTTILSIDGGGIRGVIPAIVLRAIEDRTETAIHELFDVLAGTSTGGIIALGLTRPGPSGGARFRPADLVEMYRRDGRVIFPPAPLGKIRQLFWPKYAERGRAKVLTERFGETMLSEALTEVIVTSYDVEARRPVFFRTALAKQNPGGAHDFAMRDVALATSAAPTYFRPVALPDQATPGRQMALVDGGVYANNPGMCGFVDKTTVQGRRQGTVMVSLGTGRLTEPLPYREAKHWGLFGWGPHIIDVVFDGITESVEYELQTILGPDYHRLQVTLEHSEEAMDNVSASNVDALVSLADDLVRRDPNGELAKACDALKACREAKRSA